MIVSNEMRAEIVELVRLRDAIIAATNLPENAFTVIAPPGWASSPSRVYGMWVRVVPSSVRSELAIESNRVVRGERSG
jgi:BarA-like signal transduction histidine kinase